MSFNKCGILSFILFVFISSQGDSFTKYAENVVKTIKILESQGFYIKIYKAEIIPKEQFNFSGFIIDSPYMIVTLTIEKKQIFNLRTDIKLAHIVTFKELVKLIGNLLASMETVSYEKRF